MADSGKIELPNGYEVAYDDKGNKYIGDEENVIQQTDRGFEEIDLLFDNTLSLSISSKIRDSYPNRVEVLDLGSGSEAAACREIESIYEFKGTKEVRATGIDLYPNQSRGTHAVQGDMKDLPFKDNAFDVIFSWKALWYLPAQYNRQMVQEIGRVLKPGGVAILDWMNLDYSEFQTWVTEEGMAARERLSSFEDSRYANPKINIYMIFKPPVDQYLEVLSHPPHLAGDFG